MSLNLTAETYIRNLDSRAMPRYSFGEAAAYLGLPESTIRAWFSGMPYGQAPNIRQYRPLLKPASGELLCFYDIASAHVLMSLKAKGVSPRDIRGIVQGLQNMYPHSAYPLLGRDFYLFGKDVVVKEVGKRLNLTRGGQMGFRAIMDKFLARIELDANMMPVRFSPLRTYRERGRGYIVIDPDFASGRPVIKGTGVAAEVIAKRKDSGDSIAYLAKDYRISRRAIEEAIKYFPKGKAA